MEAENQSNLATTPLCGKRRTKYRVRQTGFGREWLEYKQFLFWHPVPIPYCHNVYYRELCDASNGWQGNNFECFIKTYPDIKVYLRNEYYPEQAKLEKQADEWNREYDKRSISIRRLSI